MDQIQARLRSEMDQLMAVTRDMVHAHGGFTTEEYKSRIADLEARVREVEGEIDRANYLPGWIIKKLKTLGDYYESPKDERDVTGEIQGWMHVLCFHYVQNRREVKEYDAARRTAKQAESDLSAARVTIGELVVASERVITAVETGEVQCDVINGRWWPAYREFAALVARHQTQQ